MENGKGLFKKYVVTKADGSPVDPKAVYFVLRLDTDETARGAAYHYLTRTRDLKLAHQLIDLLHPFTEASLIAHGEGVLAAEEKKVEEKKRGKRVSIETPEDFEKLLENYERTCRHLENLLCSSPLAKTSTLNLSNSKRRIFDKLNEIYSKLHWENSKRKAITCQAFHCQSNTEVSCEAEEIKIDHSGHCAQCVPYSEEQVEEELRTGQHRSVRIVGQEKKKFRGESGVVEAERWFGHGHPVPDGCVEHLDGLYVETDFGTVKINEGDWVITNSKGERHTCIHDTFIEVYEPIESPKNEEKGD